MGGREKLVVGASSGGVVSVSGDPFTPEKRETNVTLARVMEALEPRINSLRATVTEEAKTEVVGALMKSLEGWGNVASPRKYAARRADHRAGQARASLLTDRQQRRASDPVEAAQPGLEWGQLHDAGVGEEGV
ncbi:hypothetical protein [Aeromonas veronii]|uniref:hypothetical protein n=1 Tax=Aeromonas veronii TaxID=654 RepID=UPI000EAD59C7|nr:hypothetical protein [Aeromonas veronii]AYK20494.1 hypothetical protein C0073_022520 [Aeromonas veronii]